MKNWRICGKSPIKKCGNKLSNIRSSTVRNVEHLKFVSDWFQSVPNMFGVWNKSATFSYFILEFQVFFRTFRSKMSNVLSVGMHIKIGRIINDDTGRLWSYKILIDENLTNVLSVLKSFDWITEVVYNFTKWLGAWRVIQPP